MTICAGMILTGHLSAVLIMLALHKQMPLSLCLCMGGFCCWDGHLVKHFKEKRLFLGEGQGCVAPSSILIGWLYPLEVAIFYFSCQILVWPSHVFMWCHGLILWAWRFPSSCWNRSQCTSLPPTVGNYYYSIIIVSLSQLFCYILRFFLCL